MSDALLLDLTREGLWIAVQMSAPLLTAALVAGLGIGLLQALTSVQEATLTFVPKVATMLAVFWVTMDFMTTRLVDFLQRGLLPAIAGG